MSWCGPWNWLKWENSRNCFKSLCRDDDVKARPLFKNPITFRPKFTLLIITNYNPTFGTKSYAMKRRVKLFNFDAKYEENPTKPNEKNW